MVDHRVEGVEDELVGGGIAGHRLGGLLDDRDPAPAVDVDPLAVNTYGADGLPARGVADPPLRPVTPVAAGHRADRFGPGRERLPAATGLQGRDDGGGDDLPAAGGAVVEHHHREAGKVTGCGVEAAAGHQGAAPVQQHIGFGLGTQLGPQHVGHLILEGLSGDPVGHPVDDVGLGGLIAEDRAVLQRRVLLQGGQEVIETVRGADPRDLQPPQCHSVSGDTRFQIGVVLAEVHRVHHVQDLADGGPGERRGTGQFGDDVGDLLALREHAVGRRHQGEQPGEGFGARHHLMRLGGVHAVGVVLVDQPVGGGDQERVGVGLAQERREVRDAAVAAGHLQIADGGVDLGVDRCRGAAGADRRRRKDGAHVLIGPPVVGRHHQGVGAVDPLVGRGREALHQAEFRGAGVRVVGHRGDPSRCCCQTAVFGRPRCGRGKTSRRPSPGRAARATSPERGRRRRSRGWAGRPGGAGRWGPRLALVDEEADGVDHVVGLGAAPALRVIGQVAGVAVGADLLAEDLDGL